MAFSLIRKFGVCLKQSALRSSCIIQQNHILCMKLWHYLHSIFISYHLKIILFSKTLATLSHVRQLQKNLDLKLSHFPSNLSLLRRGSNVRHINALCEVCLHSHYSAKTPHPRNPFEPLRRRELQPRYA